MKEILATEINATGTIAATVFTLPEQPSELFTCLIDFVLIVVLITLLKSAWNDYMTLKGIPVSKKQKILFWELVTFTALFTAYITGHFCVILPLLFMLTILVLWYLVQVYAR